MRIKTMVAFMALVLAIGTATAQQTENVIIITTDGLRWQELFKGMDQALANDPRFHEDDSVGIYARYWSDNEQERRKKLLPFFWNTIAGKGQLYGNRALGSKVNNANPYWFSYPGYSEILCGYVDEKINTNSYPANPNTTVLEFFNQQASLKGKVAAFGAWDAFDRIINEERSGIPVMSAFDTCGGTNPNEKELLINAMLRDSYKPWSTAESFDVFTHYAAMEHLKKNKPRVLYIAYGETDEWAHAGKYSSYLNAAKQVDKWIGDLWNHLQTDPQYKNKTSILITTDHGRGDKNKAQWTSHGAKVEGADEIWMAVMGPEVVAKGEVKTNSQFYQKQFAQTIARLMRMEYKAAHPVASAIEEVLK